MNVSYESDCVHVLYVQNYGNKQKEWNTATKPFKKIKVINLFASMTFSSCIIRRTVSVYRARAEEEVHSGTEVVLVREGPRAGGGSSQRKKGSDYFTSPVKTMTLRDIK
jgi:hypothetical protein